MKTILFFFFFIISNLSFAAPKILIQFSQNEVKQGSIVNAKISIDSESFQQFNLQKLKGETLAESLYVYQVNPAVRRSGEAWFDSEASIIFVKIPESRQLLHKNNEIEISISLSQIKVKPTEVPQSFIFGEFSIPVEINFGFWISVLAGLIVIGFIARKYVEKLRRKKELKRIKDNLKAELLGVKTFEDAVLVWQKKQIFLKEFPVLEESFLKFQGILFKYQFKQKQSDLEKEEVLQAYQALRTNIEEKKNGI